jgi:hypothetical protein
LAVLNRSFPLATTWFERFCIKAIDAPLTISWNVEVSLRCVDGSLGKDLSTMFFYFSLKIYDVLQGCVDLALETFTLSGLLNEDFTDLPRSDLLETQKR